MYKTYPRGKEKWSLVLSFTDDKGFSKTRQQFLRHRLHSDPSDVSAGWKRVPVANANDHVCTSIKHKSNKFRHPQVWRKSCAVQTKQREKCPQLLTTITKERELFIFFHYTGTTCATVSCIRSPNMRRHRLRGGSRVSVWTPIRRLGPQTMHNCYLKSLYNTFVGLFFFVVFCSVLCFLEHLYNIDRCKLRPPGGHTTSTD